jgi:hypothetical protein
MSCYNVQRPSNVQATSKRASTSNVQSAYIGCAQDVDVMGERGTPNDQAPQPAQRGYGPSGFKYTNATHPV